MDFRPSTALLTQRSSLSCGIIYDSWYLDKVRFIFKLTDSPISLLVNTAFVVHIIIGCHGNKAFHNKKMFLTVFFGFLHNK
jgi:hypothetical protein